MSMYAHLGSTHTEAKLEDYELTVDALEAKYPQGHPGHSILTWVRTHDVEQHLSPTQSYWAWVVARLAKRG